MEIKEYKYEKNKDEILSHPKLNFEINSYFYLIEEINIDLNTYDDKINMIQKIYEFDYKNILIFEDLLLNNDKNFLETIEKKCPKTKSIKELEEELNEYKIKIESPEQKIRDIIKDQRQLCEFNFIANENSQKSINEKSKEINLKIKEIKIKNLRNLLNMIKYCHKNIFNNDQFNIDDIFNEKNSDSIKSSNSIKSDDNFSPLSLIIAIKEYINNYDYNNNNKELKEKIIIKNKELEFLGSNCDAIAALKPTDPNEEIENLKNKKEKLIEDKKIEWTLIYNKLFSKILIYVYFDFIIILFVLFIKNLFIKNKFSKYNN